METNIYRDKAILVVIISRNKGIQGGGYILMTIKA